MLFKYSEVSLHKFNPIFCLSLTTFKKLISIIWLSNIPWCKEFIWISSNEMDETGAHYIEWSKPETKTITIY